MVKVKGLLTKWKNDVINLHKQGLNERAITNILDIPVGSIILYWSNLDITKKPSVK